MCTVAVPPWGCLRVAPVPASPRQCSPVITGAQPHTTGAQPRPTGSQRCQTGCGWLDLRQSVGVQSVHLMGQINNGYKPVIATVFSQQTTVISRSYGDCCPKPTQRLYDGVWMSGLMILISTLPVKGEESLDLQSPLTTSPNLDNRISTPFPEQLVDSDDRHGFLTGRCGRHRQRSHTLCMLMASGEAQPLYKYAHATTCTLHRQAARLSRAVWYWVTWTHHCSLYFHSQHDSSIH